MDAQEAWLDYRRALDTLSPMAVRDVGTGAPEVDGALEQSERLERALVSDLDTADENVRSLAALKLEAAAVYDLDAANRLLATEETGALLVRADAIAEDRTDLDEILATPTALGISALLDASQRSGRFVHAAEVQPTPPERVKTATAACIDKIVADTSEAASTTIVAIAAVPGAELAAAIAEELGDRIKPVADAVSWMKERALKFVLRAVNKLLAVFGASTARLRVKLQEWLSDADGEKFKGPLNLLYRTDHLKATFAARVEDDADRVDDTRATACEEDLTRLAAAWSKHMSVINTAAKILVAVGSKIRAIAPPWSETAYYAVLVIASGYVIVGGGDTLDWNESDGLLDIVDGVGAIVDRSVAAQATTTR